MIESEKGQEGFGQDPVFTVEQLSEQIRVLGDRIERLSIRLAAIERGMPPDRNGPEKRAATAVTPPAKNALAGPQPLIDTSVLLRRIATVCFLLVIALILRTVTDNQLIDIRLGSILGMSYAAILILLGWRLYPAGSSLAPVFPGCGILLLFSIVLETHSRYASLSAGGAYLVLFLAGTTVFAMSIRHRASMLICLAVPGSAAAAMAIDFPYPLYPVLSLFLLAAVVAASYAFKQRMCRYLRWLVLGLASLFWLLWTLKMNSLPAGVEAAAAIYPGWFFPMLFVFWGAYLATVVLNACKKDLQLGFFESIIPAITAIGAFTAGNIAARNWHDQQNWFYLATTLIATLHLALAWWLARVDRKRARGSNVFILAGACLIILSSATVFRENIGSILPLWSASAVVLALLSAFLHNQGIRITSYLMQAATCAVAIASGAVLVPAESPAAAGAAAAAILFCSLTQYRWSRANPPDPAHSWYYSRIDPGDYSGAILLISGLLGGYYFFQFVLYEALTRLTTHLDHALRSGQSLIINVGAMGLLYLALRKRNRELVLIAALVALVGAGKVFIADLFGIRGVPLVLSVFSTGLVAAFGSVVLGQWPKKEGGAAEQPPLPPSS